MAQKATVSLPQSPTCTVPESACRCAPWSTAVSPHTARDRAGLDAKLYEIDPGEVMKILAHLVKG